jgi:dTDP-4-dehydrorhamnose 3,5-epimerase
VRFVPTSLTGVYVIEQERHMDERGFFARTWCADEFAEHGLEPNLAQCSVSFNPHRGTLRGLHYQAPPFAEAKLVRCSRGALFDVAVDLRPDSPTFRKWVGSELTEENGRALYVPDACRRYRGRLSDLQATRSRSSARHPLGRPVPWCRVAGAGAGHRVA